MKGSVIMNQYARTYNGVVYAVDINIDESRLPENAQAVDFSDAVVAEINADIAYAMHDIDGTLIRSRKEMYDEMKQLNTKLNTEVYPTEQEVYLANHRLMQGRSQKSDDALHKKVAEKVNHITRVKELHDVLKVVHDYDGSE